jgi:hypothetical protein
MSLNQQLINNLTKKDEDLEVISDDGYGSMVVNTSLNIGEEFIENNEENEEEQTYKSVNIQIIHYLLNFIIAVTLLFGILGLFPYFILTKYGSPLISGTLLCISFITYISINVLCYVFQKNTELLYSLFSVLLICLFTMSCTIAAYFETFAPFQGCIIIFIQLLSLSVYSLYERKNLNPWWSLSIMLFSGFIIWIFIFFAFIEQRQWISSGLLLLFNVFGFSGYTVFEITVCTKKYHLKELTRVIVGFFTNFYILPIEWIYAKYVKNNKDLSFVLVGKNNTAQQPVLE